MPTYEVLLKETVTYQIPVEADSPAQAVEQAWADRGEGWVVDQEDDRVLQVQVKEGGGYRELDPSEWEEPDGDPGA